MTSNNISWSFTSGDPNPVSIIITNGNDTFLNGNFSIAEYVDLSPKVRHILQKHFGASC